MNNELYQKEETKRQGIWAFVVTVGVIVLGIIMFTGCRQEHEFRVKCIEAGGYWQQDRTCINASPN